MKKVIVTGGMGFIGSNLVEFLIKKNFFVIIVDNFSYSANKSNLNDLPKKKFKIYKFNIQNKKKFLYILNKYKPSGIFNLAAETHVDRSIDNPKYFINSNIYGVFSILEALKKYCFKKKNIKMIHVSTDEVYGDIKKNNFSLEADTYKPSSPYAASKASSDLLIEAYVKTYQLPCIITNCSNNYGPKQFPEKFIPKVIMNLINNRNIPVYGNGQQEREWIYVKDHCSALYKIFKIGKAGDKVNIGSGNIIKNINIVKILIKKFSFFSKKNSQSKINFVKDRPGHDKRYALNSNKLKRKYKWKKNYNLQKGLDDTVKWYLNNNLWLKKLDKKKYTKRLGLKKI